MRISLVLGSGGARGYAHIGAIRALTERGHEIAAVAGTSAGALVGGVAVAGRLDEFESWVRGLTQRDVVLLLDPAISGGGVIRAERVLSRVSGLLDDVLIEDLPLPFTAVATDLHARREVWFQRGPLAAAIRASISIPTLITPVEQNGRVLVDGGILNPVPMEPVLAAGADATLAVSLNGEREKDTSSPVQADAPADDAPQWRRRLRRAPKPKSLRTYDVLTLSLEAVEAMVTRHRLATIPPDVHVAISAAAAGTLDFHRADELIAVGHQATIQALDAAGW